MGSDSAYLAQGDKDEFNPDRWMSNASNEPAKRSAETQLNVLIVGGGPAGLMTALECWRKGHNIVGILERSQGPVYAGSSSDLIPHVLQNLPHIKHRMTNLQPWISHRRHYRYWPFGSMYPPSLARNVS